MKNKFKVGQKIVAIQDHAEGYFKKGDTFSVLDIDKTCCVNVVKVFNTKNISGAMTCVCGNYHKTNSYLFNENSFNLFTEISEMSYNEAVEMVSNKQLI